MPGKWTQTVTLGAFRFEHVDHVFIFKISDGGFSFCLFLSLLKIQPVDIPAFKKTTGKENVVVVQSQLPEFRYSQDRHTRSQEDLPQARQF